MARRVRDRSVGDSRERAGRRAAVAAAMVVLAGVGSAAVGAAGSASPSATPQTGDCLTGAWAYSAYSSRLDDLQLSLSGVQIEMGPGYVAVSSLDGSATGTLGPDTPNATYEVAMSGTGAMASLEDGTIRWYADAVTGGLTGTPGGGTQGAQALVPELPMTVSCDATTARLATAGGTMITLTRSILVPQPPTPLPPIPDRSPALDCLEGTWVLDTTIDARATTSLEYTVASTIDFRDGVWTHRLGSDVAGQYEGQDVTARLAGQSYGFYDTADDRVAIDAPISADGSVSEVELAGGGSTDDPALLASLQPTIAGASYEIACAGDNLVLSGGSTAEAAPPTSTDEPPAVADAGVALVLHRPGTEPSDTTTTTVPPTTTVAPTTVAPSTTAAPTAVAPTTVAPTTVAPSTTAAPSTAAPTTVAPTTTVAAPPPTGAQPPASSVPVSDAFAFPWTFWHVPQMGTEVVEGSGCGANGDLPDTIPDGLWYGQVISANADGLAFDVRCLFYGELATQLYQEYVGEHPDEASPPYIDGTWTVNNSTRTRNVPVSANFAIYPAEAVPVEQLPDGGVRTECRVPDGAAATADDPTLFSDAWLAIVDGRAVWMVGSCPHD